MAQGRLALTVFVGLGTIAAATAPAEEPLRERIDRAIEAKAGGRVAGPADDAEFVRRVFIDLTGMTPSAAEARAFLDDGDPPIVFTPGSAMDRGHSFFEEAVKALKSIGRRGILISRFADTIPAGLPGYVKHFPYVPFSQVLPRAAAMVYHGGIGTCAQALRAGVPQLLMPMAHDQLDNLSRVRELGTGDGLHPRQFKAKRIAATLDRLLHDPALKQRAKEIAGRFDPPGWMARTCDLVEEMKP